MQFQYHKGLADLTAHCLKFEIQWAFTGQPHYCLVYPIASRVNVIVEHLSKLSINYLEG